MAELVCDSDQPAQDPSSGNQTRDPSDAGGPAAQDAGGSSWQIDIKGLVLPHLAPSLVQVRRSLSFQAWLIQINTAFTLIGSSSLMLLSGHTAFNPQLSGPIQTLLLKVAALIALGFLTLQRVISAGLNFQQRELKKQELTYLSCVNAIARNDSEAFERVMMALWKSMRS